MLFVLTTAPRIHKTDTQAFCESLNEMIHLELPPLSNSGRSVVAKTKTKNAKTQKTQKALDAPSHLHQFLHENISTGAEISVNQRPSLLAAPSHTLHRHPLETR